jgi:transposase
MSHLPHPNLGGATPAGPLDAPPTRLAPSASDEVRDRPAAGLTVRDVARRYRVGEDKVRAWIRRGELRAINTAMVLCGRPRWVVTHDAIAEFERRRAGGPPPKQPRRKKRTELIDYFPD